MVKGYLQKMLIGELARQAGVTPDTIRFYEKKGLLYSKQVTRKGNNYKDYHPATLERLLLISRAKAAGFTLGEIYQWIHEWHLLNPDDKRQVFTDKIQHVENRIVELDKMKAYLVTKMAVALQK